MNGEDLEIFFKNGKFVNSESYGWNIISFWKSLTSDLTDSVEEWEIRRVMTNKDSGLSGHGKLDITSIISHSQQNVQSSWSLYDL